MPNFKSKLLDEVEALKSRKKAVILAHNYQPPEIQDAADYVGDSFELSRVAAESKAEVIVFCGVFFMAEVAAILDPHKVVLLPEMAAGCPLADTITAAALRERKKQHPEAAVVTYINSPAAVKAESDVCVTSSNAVHIVDTLEADEILFVPDMNLGSYVARHTANNKKVHTWNGCCESHHIVTGADVQAARAAHPKAVLLAHPECQPEVVEAADHVFSTGGMLKYADQTDDREMLIGTEQGLLYRLQKENPHKRFYSLSPKMYCPTMKMITPEKIISSLKTLRPRVAVPEDIREPARKALERMLQLAAS